MNTDHAGTSASLSSVNERSLALIESPLAVTSVVRIDDSNEKDLSSKYNKLLQYISTSMINLVSLCNVILFFFLNFPSN